MSELNTANVFTGVSIILPAINETTSFRETVDVILKTCHKNDLCEFLIVLCDKTTPDCVQTANEICNMNSGVATSIYYQQRPFVGAAMQEAFERVKGSHVVMMSTDLETDPHLIKVFIERATRNPDHIITTSRWIKGGGFEGYSKIKLISNFIFQRIIAILFGCKNTDLTYGYRIFPTKLMQSIIWEEAKHPFFLETALKPLRLCVKIDEIPAKWVARVEGESQNSFFKNFEYFRTAYRIKRMKREDILKTNCEGI